MSKAKKSYLVFKTSLPPSRLMKKLPKFDLYPAQSQGSMDCIVFSLAYERYSYNNLEYIQKAPINLHVCESLEDFVAYIEAFSVGADLSNLWKLV